MYSIGVEFSFLASGKFSRSDGRVSKHKFIDLFKKKIFIVLEIFSSCNHQERMKTLQGLVMTIQSFGGELPFFFISGWFINKIGHVNAMTLVLFAFGIRLTLYSVLTNPWWVLPIEFMQGITFGIFFAAMAMYASIVAPSGTAATLQV